MKASTIHDRNTRLLNISTDLHEILFHVFVMYQSDNAEVYTIEVLRELKHVHLRLSGLIDHCWMFGREFVRPIAELRSKVNSYEMYLKQMG